MYPYVVGRKGYEGTNISIYLFARIGSSEVQTPSTRLVVGDTGLLVIGGGAQRAT